MCVKNDKLDELLLQEFALLRRDDWGPKNPISGTLSARCFIPLLLKELISIEKISPTSEEKDSAALEIIKLHQLVRKSK